MKEFFDNFLDNRIVVATLPFIQAVLIVIFGLIINRIIRKILTDALSKSKHLDHMLNTFIVHATDIVIWVVVILSALNKVGIDSTSVITVLAAAGAAVALALQGSLSNFASGILLMFTKPFKKGDYISTTGIEGTVDSIDLLYTTIVTGDYKVITVPNASLTANTITNWTKAERRRIEVFIGVAYGSDLEKARRVLVELAKSDKRVLADPVPYCNVCGYGDSSINLSLRMWVNPPDIWDVEFDMKNSIDRTLKENGITIPFPQLDVHMDR